MIKNHRWFVIEKQSGKYCATKINNKNCYLHRFLFNLNDGNILVDHENQNTLDNRRANLRLANKSKNAMNAKLRSDNSSGIRGVSWNSSKKKWEVYININSKRIKLGYYKDLREAKKIREKADIKYYGSFRKK